jgi:hypothetical protein
MPGLVALASLLLGCASDPLALLPPLERSALHARTSLSANAQPVTVAAMLAGVRQRERGDSDAGAAGAACASASFVLEFIPGNTALTDTSRGTLAAFYQRIAACQSGSWVQADVAPGRGPTQWAPIQLAARRGEWLRAQIGSAGVSVRVNFVPQAPPDTVRVSVAGRADE